MFQSLYSLLSESICCFYYQIKPQPKAVVQKDVIQVEELLNRDLWSIESKRFQRLYLSHLSFKRKVRQRNSRLPSRSFGIKCSLSLWRKWTLPDLSINYLNNWFGTQTALPSARSLVRIFGRRFFECRIPDPSSRSERNWFAGKENLIHGSEHLLGQLLQATTSGGSSWLINFWLDI